METFTSISYHTMSTTTPERTFSSLKRLKTYLRNSTTENRLNGLALMSKLNARYGHGLVSLYYNNIYKLQKSNKNHFSFKYLISSKFELKIHVEIVVPIFNIFELLIKHLSKIIKLTRFFLRTKKVYIDYKNIKKCLNGLKIVKIFRKCYILYQIPLKKSNVLTRLSYQ